LRWAPNIGEEAATGKTANENSEIEGRIKELTGYAVHSDGNFILPENAGRFRFDFDSRFGPDRRWSSWTFKAMQRPNTWSLSVNREKQTMQFSLGEGRAAIKQTFRFADFREPQKLIGDLGLAESFPLLATLMPSTTAAGTNTSFNLNLTWDARQDWLTMGHSKVRIYRLRGHLLDQYEVVILVSRVGEILRVELPGEITLINEALINL
jgi:hypothetical protein